MDMDELINKLNNSNATDREREVLARMKLENESLARKLEMEQAAALREEQEKLEFLKINQIEAQNRGQIGIHDEKQKNARELNEDNKKQAQDIIGKMKQHSNIAAEKFEREHIAKLGTEIKLFSQYGWPIISNIENLRQERNEKKRIQKVRDDGTRTDAEEWKNILGNIEKYSNEIFNNTTSLERKTKDFSKKLIDFERNLSKFPVLSKNPTEILKSIFEAKKALSNVPKVTTGIKNAARSDVAVFKDEFTTTLEAFLTKIEEVGNNISPHVIIETDKSIQGKELVKCDYF